MRLHLHQIVDRWLNKGLLQKITFVVVLACVVFLLSASIVNIIFEKHFQHLGGHEVNDRFWQLYYYFADPGNQMSIGETAIKSVSKEQANIPDASVISTLRWIGLIISTLGSIFLSGILISTITNSFERMADKWRAGFSYYKLKGHIVIIGSDQMVYGIVNQLCERTKESIVVMTSTDVEQMRNCLWAALKNKKDKNRIIVNYGQRDSTTYLDKINVAYAKEVYVLGDTSEFDDIESFHDSLNVRCLKLIAELRKATNTPGRIICHVLFNYKTTYHIFQYADLNPEITSQIDFHPFNFYDFWARKVLVVGNSKEDSIEYQPLDHTPITSTESERFVHFIIIGMSKMGQAMALQAAHIAHFPNYKKKKTKITLIDSNCKTEMNEFKQKCGELFKVSHSTFIDADAWLNAELNLPEGKEHIDKHEEYRFRKEFHIADEYKHLVPKGDPDENFIDIEWEFINGYDHNPIIQQRLEKYASDPDAVLTVAVCLNITHISLRSAMSLPKAYYEKEIPILVQQRKTSTMVATLNGNGFDENHKNNLLYKKLKPFGMVTDCYDVQMYSSMEICKRIGYVYDHFFTYGNFASLIDQVKADCIWDNTAVSKRWSNIFAAASIPTKLRCIGIKWNTNTPSKIEELTEEQVALLSEIEHNRWNIEELLLGYRPVHKDEDEIINADRTKKKEFRNRFIHYDIRPFSELKTDASGRKANEYDEVIVKSIPLIINYNIDKYGKS